MDEIYFPPRELEVMSILWRLGSGSVSEVREELSEELAYTSVLSALQTLEEKGYVRHEPEGRAYRYFPTVEAERAGESALARIREAVFQGSAERMFAQFVSDRGLSRKELERMRRLLAERLKEEK
ncbi:MAG TPA: BlaI/MecI/CopY family transcriptional regulator [Gemmatimonadaceae bacterium]|nr:BlaI/MecI/CopY family transcriptional regulator [Gemmatimonadaceae bacterium]